MSGNKETIYTLEEIDKVLHRENILTLKIEVPLNQENFEKLANSPLGKKLENLRIAPDYDDHNPPALDTSSVKFERLKSFSLMCQAIKAFHFSKEKFPELERISIEQPCARDLAYFHSDLPKLKSLSFQFVGFTDASDFGQSLSRSRLLEMFSGYKLWGLSCILGKEILLVLPNATYLNFHRSDDLPELKLWAPKLKELNLQACYDCEKVTFLKRLPNGFRKEDYAFSGEMAKVDVNIINCSFLKRDMFRGNPRIGRVYSNEDEMPQDWSCLLL